MSSLCTVRKHSGRQTSNQRVWIQINTLTSRDEAHDAEILYRGVVANHAKEHVVISHNRHVNTRLELVPPRGGGGRRDGGGGGGAGVFSTMYACFSRIDRFYAGVASKTSKTMLRGGRGAQNATGCR